MAKWSPISGLGHLRRYRRVVVPVVALTCFEIAKLLQTRRTVNTVCIPSAGTTDTRQHGDAALRFSVLQLPLQGPTTGICGAETRGRFGGNALHARAWSNPTNACRGRGHRYHHTWLLPDLVLAHHMAWT